MANQVYETKIMVLSQYLRNLMLAALAARPAAALWPNPKVALSQDPAFNPTATSDLATLLTNEATFSGYAAATPTLVGPVNASVNVQGELSTVVFEATVASPQVANSIYGYFIHDGINYLGGENFGSAGPILVQVPGDYIQIDLIVPLGFLETA